MNLIRKKFKRLNASQTGGAILEFAIVIPILLALSFGGFEFSRSLKIAQVGSTLSREAANLAFRRCATETGASLTSCLQTVADDTVNFSRVTLPNVSIVLSVWAYDPSLDASQQTQQTSIVAATSSTTYNATDITGNSNSDCKIATNLARPFSKICKRSPGGTPINFRKPDGKSGSAVFFTPPNILENHGLIISAESYIEYQPIVGAIGNILNIQGQRYYDATII